MPCVNFAVAYPTAYNRELAVTLSVLGNLHVSEWQVQRAMVRHRITRKRLRRIARERDATRSVQRYSLLVIVQRIGLIVGFAELHYGGARRRQLVAMAFR